MKNVTEENSIADLDTYLTLKLKSINASRISLIDMLIPPAYAACYKCHCAWYAAVLLFTPGGQPSAIAAAAGGLACVS